MRVQGRSSGTLDWPGQHVFLRTHGRADESADIDKYKDARYGLKIA